MSIRNLTEDSGLVPLLTSVINKAGDRGAFFGWLDDGRAIVWWDGQDGAIDVDPDELTLAGDPR